MGKTRAIIYVAILLIAFLFALFVARASRADEACLAIDTVVTRLSEQAQEAYGSAAIDKTYTGANAAKIDTFIADQAQGEPLGPDRIDFVGHTNSDTVFLIFSKDGCITGGTPIPVILAAELLSRALGPGI